MCRIIKKSQLGGMLGGAEIALTAFNMEDDLLTVAFGCKMLSY